jgi:hypothetical protein
VGDDPVRATDAVLLDFPGAIKRITRGKSHVFLVNPRNPQPKDAWEYFKESAERRRVTAMDLYAQVKVSNEELSAPVLAQ